LTRWLLVVFIVATVFANKLLGVKCRVITTNGATRPTCAKMLLLDCCRQVAGESCI